MNLTPEQSAAVHRLHQDVCVVAGPGSGKTRILVERFRWRVEHGVSPLRILAVTFTEKAATELKQRLARDFSSSKQLREQIERAPVYTIDAFCAHLLREHAIDAGLDPSFEVLDPSEAYAELWASAEEALDGLLDEDRAAMRSLLGAIDLTDPIAGLIEVYQAMRVTVLGVNPAAASGPAGSGPFQALQEAVRRTIAASPSGWNPAQRRALAGVQEWGQRLLALDGGPPTLEHFRVLGEFDCNLTTLKRGNAAYEDIRDLKNNLVTRARQALVAEYYAAERALLWQALVRLDRIYRERKQARLALDFADLEELAIRLLRDRESLRERVRRRFDEVLMDELQDTNPLQAKLIELVRRPDRFFAVGDINQSIYGFRHAEPRVFRLYRDALRANGRPVDELRQNHRSRAAILFAAEAILDGAEGIEPQPLEPCRAFAPKSDPSVEVIAALADTADDAAELEGRLVARRIRELEGTLAVQGKQRKGERPACLADMVVLLRNINALAPIEQALRELDIPYLVGRGKRFYEAQEVTDLVHLLRVIVNSRDEMSMAAVLRSPLAAISNEALFRLKQMGNLGGALGRIEFADTTGFGSADLDRLRAFSARLHQMRAEADDVSPDRLLLRAMDAAGYESTLSARDRANVRKLLGRLRDWYAAHPQPLSRLVEELEFLRASDPDEPSAPPEDSVNAVRLMTVHSAKGLEFPIVFLAAMHKGVANESPPLAFSPSAGLVARWLDPVTQEPVKDLPYSLFGEEQKRKAREEENRLLYVAITRAEEHLVLSFAKAGRAARNWAGKVIERFGVDLSAPQARPRVFEPPSARRPFPVRLWITDACDVARAAAAVAPLEGGLARPARPALEDQHDSAASVTAITAFAHCPRQYYLAKYLGFQAAGAGTASSRTEVDDESLDTGELGRQVHDLLAKVPVHNAPPLAFELAARFASSELGERAAAAARVEREFDFLMAIGDTVVEGRIDLWFAEGEELVVVDYKTDDVDRTEAVARAGEYALQLRLYALALERMTGRRPGQALLYFLRPDVVIEVDLDPESLAAAEQAVHDLARAQHELRFPLNVGHHCHRCAFYRGLCPGR